MKDIVKDVAIITMAKKYEELGLSPSLFLRSYFEPHEHTSTISFLEDMELIYKVYPKNEWLHTDYNAEPELFWHTY